MHRLADFGYISLSSVFFKGKITGLRDFRREAPKKITGFLLRDFGAKRREKITGRKLQDFRREATKKLRDFCYGIFGA